jgi:putative glutamine amidotransferase
MKNVLHFLLALSAVILLQNCAVQGPDPKIQIALSKGSPDSSYTNYYNWIESLDSTVVCIDLYAMPTDSAIMLFRSCSGLILTGGTDIHPDLYGKAYDTVRCWPVDNHRDRLEMTLIDSALTWGMPVLGICRGHQMLNVTLGGSLIVDIPADFDTVVNHQCEDYLACFHPVDADTSSLLFSITGTGYGEVTSNHHQAADRIAPALRVSAFASDGLPEALEWKDYNNKSFLLGVQWHPERMEPENPFSGAIGRTFLAECYLFGRQTAVSGWR